MAIARINESQAIIRMKSWGWPTGMHDLMGMGQESAQWAGNRSGIVADYRKIPAVDCKFQIAVYDRNDQLLDRFNVI